MLSQAPPMATCQERWKMCVIAYNQSIHHRQAHLSFQGKQWGKQKNHSNHNRGERLVLSRERSSMLLKPKWRLRSQTGAKMRWWDETNHSPGTEGAERTERRESQMAEDTCLCLCFLPHLQIMNHAWQTQSVFRNLNFVLFLPQLTFKSPCCV